MIKNSIVDKKLWFKNDFNRSSIAWIIMFGFFAISISGMIFPHLESFSARLANRNQNSEGLIEFFEAFFWLFSLIIYLIVFLKSIKRKSGFHEKLWLVFFVLFCLVAFGEETSWGQHIFGFNPPESVRLINQQNEFNFHNLNISQLVGLGKESPLYKYLKNFTTIINPLFYLVCSLIWVVFPVTKIFTKKFEKGIFSAMPVPAVSTIIFFGINIVFYIIVDKLFFDVGEVFELAISLTAILSAVDLWFKKMELNSISAQI